MEYWDLFDSQRQPLHRIHRRGDDLLPGSYHLVVEVWVIDSAEAILLTLRDEHKDWYPGKWECPSGSALAGESSRQAAVRELWEETGIHAEQEELVFLGSTQDSSAFFDAYVLRRNKSSTRVTLQPGETAAAQWVNRGQLIDMAAEQSLALPVAQRLTINQQAFDNFIDNL